MLTSASQYLFAYVCCHKSCRLLARKDTWLLMLKLIGVVSFLLQMFCLIWDRVYTEKIRQEHDFYVSCTTFYWFALNCSQNLILGFFVFIGVCILRSIYRYKPETELAQKLHQEHRTAYMRQLGTCVVTLLMVICIGNFYTTFLYFREKNLANPSCTRITGSWALNQMFWLVQRSLIYSLWVYPFMWMHWKELPTAKPKPQSETDWFAKSTQNGKRVKHSEDSSSDSDDGGAPRTTTTSEYMPHSMNAHRLILNQSEDSSHQHLSIRDSSCQLIETATDDEENF